MTKETKLLLSIDQYITTTIGNICDTITKVLTSFDTTSNCHAQKHDNKSDINIKGLHILQYTSKATNFFIPSLLHPNMGGENQNESKMTSHIHPFPL